MFDVSIVIVTWNGREHLARCLAAVAAQRGVTTETILVDNASSDGTADYVRREFPWVRLVALGENRGFAGGNNAGAAVATGRTIFCLNNDTEADPDCVRRLLDALDPGERVALSTARIVYMHDPTVVDSAGDGYLRAGGAYKHFHGQGASLAVDSREVFGVCGAACLLPRDLFERLGGFDEDFFFSHEDVDLSYRARLLGYRARYVADAVVHHHGSGTSGKASDFAVFQGQRNLEWVYVKDTPGALLLRTLPAHLLYVAAAGAYFARVGRFGAFVRAKMAALAGLPLMLRKRAEVQRTRTVSLDALTARMDRGWLRAKIQEKRFDAGMVEDGL